MQQRLALAVALVLTTILAGCGGKKEVAVGATPDPIRLTLSDAASIIKNRRTSSFVLTQLYVTRAERASDLNAFITIDRQNALLTAQQRDDELSQGRTRGPLHGVPIVVKDNIHVAGMPNTAGTIALKNFVPTTNAPVVQRLIDAGAIVIGKTSMHELAFGISGYNEAYKTGDDFGTRNPYDPRRFAGGSSSGTGAAIAARLAPGGLGSDTGGSVRIPAGVTGIAGFRPTTGRYPGHGVTPITHSRDTPGPMGITVEDVALLDSVITGEKQPITRASLSGLRVGFYRKFHFAGLDEDTSAVVEDVLKRLRGAGVELVAIEMSELPNLADRTRFAMALYDAKDDMEAYLRNFNTGVTLDQLVGSIASKDVKGTYQNLVMPRKVPTPNGVIDAGPAYVAAMSEAYPRLWKYMDDIFNNNRVDVIIYPTTPAVAAMQGPDASNVETFLKFIRNTDPTSVAGLPSLSIPAAIGPSTDMPVGIEIAGPRGSDRRVLAIGMAIEDLLGRMPPPKRDR